MRSFFFAALVVFAFANKQEELLTQKLKKTNSALRQALSSLSTEESVGLSDWCRTACGTSRKGCTNRQTYKYSNNKGAYGPYNCCCDQLRTEVQVGSECRFKKIRSGGFCASSVRLGDTTEPSICMGKAVNNNQCHGQLDGVRFFFLDKNGGCFCSTDDCGGQYSSDARTLYKTTCAQEDIDCVLGSYNKDNCGISCYIEREITKPATGFGKCSDRDRYVECANGDGDCVDEVEVGGGHEPRRGNQYCRNDMGCSSSWKCKRGRCKCCR